MIFGKNKKAAKKSDDSSVTANSAVAATPKKGFSYRITEKASRLGENNVYVFNVLVDSNKIEIKKELEAKYKVTVEEIKIINFPKKKVFSRGRLGVKGGGKKAYITLKKGDSIVLE